MRRTISLFRLLIFGKIRGVRADLLLSVVSSTLLFGVDLRGSECQAAFFLLLFCYVNSH